MRPDARGLRGPRSARASLDLGDDNNILTLKRVIYQRVVEVKDMPAQNATGMTQEERDRIASWYQAGAKP